MSTSAPDNSAGPVTFLPLGALIQSFTVGGHNLVLGLPSASLYPTHNAPFFGETIGRVANRIANGRIDALNGRSYSLSKNEKGATTLHGGEKGWGKRVWEGPTPVERNGGREEVLFEYVSRDGEEGFPGTVRARVWYWVGRKVGGAEGGMGREEVTLEVEYEVELVDGEDAQDISETVVAVTNHSYWTVTAAPTITGTYATFSTTLHQPIDPTYSIPTGPITPFPNLTANTPTLLGDHEPAIDHCFVLSTAPETVPLDTRGQEMVKAVELRCPATGLGMRLETTEPAFQFYTGEGVAAGEVEVEDARGEKVKVPARERRAGIAIEPSRLVNAVNVPEWRGMVVLGRGEVWGSRSRYVAWVE